MRNFRSLIKLAVLLASCQNGTVESPLSPQPIAVNLNVSGPAGETRTVRAIVTLDGTELQRFAPTALDSGGRASFRMTLDPGTRGTLAVRVQAIADDTLLSDTAQASLMLSADTPYSVNLPLVEVDYCGTDRWCWSRPKRVGTYFTDVWGTAADDIWVVGTSGRPLHYDGFAFSEVPLIDDKIGTPEEIITPRFSGIHGSSTTDVWASSALYLGKTPYNALWKFDGTSFRAVYRIGSNFAGGEGFTSILVTPSYLWVNGCKFTRQGNFIECNLPSKTIITRMIVPDPAKPDEFWGTARQNGIAAIYHWDGTTMQTESINNVPLQDLQVADDGTLLASTFTNKTVIQRKGASWNDVNPASIIGLVLSASSSSDMWSLSGSNDGPYVEIENKILQHWNGTKMEDIKQFPIGLPIQKAFTVPGTGRSSIILAGDGGAVYRFDRNTKQVTTLLKGASTSPYRLNDVYGFSKNDIWAVGGNGTITHYDGKSWTDLPLVTKKPLNRIWGTSSSDLWIVGDAQENPVPSPTPPPEAAVIHVVNGKPILQKGWATANLNSVWGTSSGKIYAVGNNSTALVALGGPPSPLNIGIGPNINLHSVWASSDSNIIIGTAAASPNSIIRYDGTSWKPTAAMGTSPVYNIRGSSPSNILIGFLVGTYRTDWNQWFTASYEGSKAVYTFGPNSWFASSGEFGFYTAQSAGKALPGTQPGPRETTGMWGYSPYDLWMTGGGGTVLHLNPKAQLPW